MGYRAIHVENLGKRYRIGGTQANYKLLSETLASVFTAPARLLRRADNGFTPANTLWALKDVSFDVQSGEVIGIIGSNGAGKSTLLKILSRITLPTEGRAEVRGRVGSLLEVGTGFHGELTGRENLYLYGATLGMTRAEIARKFDEIVQFAQVEKFIDTPIKRYSSGMHTRLAFSVAAHLEPEILLVDEVLAVGDIAFQKKCLGKMQDVSKQGRTVLFVSHNMVAVTTLVTRCIWLDHGKVMEIGPTQDVIGHYLNSNSLNRGALTFAENPKLFAQIKRVALLDDQNNLTSVVRKNGDIRLEIEFVVRETDAGRIDVCSMISVSAGASVYYFGLSETPEGHTIKLEKGHYRMLVEFPAWPLNYGHYIARAGTLLGIKHHHNHIVTGEGIDFEVVPEKEVDETEFVRRRSNESVVTTITAKRFDLEKCGDL